MALAEVLVMGEDEAITEAEIAANVDDYLFNFPAREKNIIKLALTGPRSIRCCGCVLRSR